LYQGTSFTRAARREKVVGLLAPCALKGHGFSRAIKVADRLRL